VVMRQGGAISPDAPRRRFLSASYVKPPGETRQEANNLPESAQLLHLEPAGAGLGPRGVSVGEPEPQYSDPGVKRAGIGPIGYEKNGSVGSGWTSPLPASLIDQQLVTGPGCLVPAQDNLPLQMWRRLSRHMCDVIPARLLSSKVPWGQRGGGTR
jgi:hypothetical protein